MRSTVIFFLFLLGVCPVLKAQQYFQQEVNYTIQVSLNDVNHSLKGYETIQYINNSPDRLDFLYFHIWPNAYKNNSTAYARQQVENGHTRFNYAKDSERGYIDSLDFMVNNLKATYVPDIFNIDICKITLPEPLMPGDTVTISTPFYVKIPGSFSRFGHVGQSYQITQWYPKPAVYDIHGWNQMPYLDQGEFYSEYGSFDVSITLPKNYVVGATGNLVTPEEIEWLDKKTKDTTLVGNIPASDKELKTIRYQEKNVHDFAWFADKRYKVMMSQVVLGNGHKVTTWTMFPLKQAELWKESISYVNDAIRYYSAWYGNYPYNNCTAVYGSIKAGGAMEYPTITVVGDASNRKMLEDFIMHEVGHNWFYGMLGFNERRYPFLDEGINSFSELRYMQTKYPGLKLYQWMMNKGALAPKLNLTDVPYSAYNELSYLLPARNNLDQPINLSSEKYTEMNYGGMVYYKSAMTFTYLMQYLGEEKFDSIMQHFFLTWQYKHPGPEDFREAFTKSCSEDLSWLFDGLIATTGKVDYAIKRIKADKVLVKNKGQISSPVYLSGLQGNSITHSQWYPGFIGSQWLDFNSRSADRIVLFDSILLPEMNRKNDILKTNGLFKRIEPLNFRAIQIIEKPEKTEIGILPGLGWNNYNKFMLGLLVYSPLLPQQTFEYQFVPLVGFGNHDISGMGRVALNLLPDLKMIRSIQLSLDARRFGYGINNGESYNRLKGEMLISLNNASARSTISKSLKLAMITADEPLISNGRDFMENYFLTLNADFADKNVFNPYQINLNVEVNNDYARSSVELNYSHALKYSGKALNMRIFVASFISKGSGYNDFYALRLSGASGINDYKYENLYFGRYEQIGDPNRQVIFSQQFVMGEGGFASNNPFATSGKWLASIGLSWRIPVLPFLVYANAGTYSGAGDTDWQIDETHVVASERYAYEAGIMVQLTSVIKVYFPLLTSRDIRDVNDVLTDNYLQTIRYSIDLNAINPFRIKNNMF